MSMTDVRVQVARLQRPNYPGQRNTSVVSQAHGFAIRLVCHVHRLVVKKTPGWYPSVYLSVIVAGAVEFLQTGGKFSGYESEKGSQCK